MGQTCCVAETPRDEDASAVQPSATDYQSVLPDGDPQSTCVTAEDVPRLLDAPRRAIVATAAAADLCNGKDPAGQTGPKKMVMLLQEAEHLVDGGLDEWLRDWCTDEVLRMFLGASSKESAVKSLAAALNWRRRYKDVLTGLRTPCWQGDMRVVARGVSGHPVIFMSMHHQPSKSNSISTAEHLAVVLEAAVCSAKGTPRSFDVVCDCRGFQLSKNLDPRPAVSAMEMLKHAYRGRMRRAFLVGAPAAFGGFWKLLKGLLPKPTQDKIQFIALKEAGDVLQGSCGHAAAHVVTTLLASDQDSTSWRFPSELADRTLPPLHLHLDDGLDIKCQALKPGAWPESTPWLLFYEGPVCSKANEEARMEATLRTIELTELPVSIFKPCGLFASSLPDLRCQDRDCTVSFCC